ncbi:PREDICTED: uncharacterized protein LOC106742059 [Dinoponera quadriceps]|uniref:Uncharacterized protein LOC106742059 n=1 Tax=Dinoponera quadriceps TaxID=609295 RepID=A0A6P3WVR4_DINQU|nr:PREDICTED: uncharacterized protein LOC106742059 [Dinoponera quadriceps]
MKRKLIVFLQLHSGQIIFSIVVLLFAIISDAQPIDYDDVVNLLPTEPQTTNDTLAAIVRDPVVQVAVQDTVGNGTLEGLVVKKKVLIMPATEPTKVVSQREQVLVVPVTNLEDVRKNITESAKEKANEDSLVLTDVGLFTENGEKESHKDESNPPDIPQRIDFYETLDEFSETTRKPNFLIDDDHTPREIPYLLPNPRQEMERPDDHQPPSTISVPIIAFLNSAKISNDKIEMPIAAALSQPDDASESRLELLKNGRDEIQQNVQDYIDRNSWSVDPDYWQLTSAPSQTPLLYEPATTENQYAGDVRPEISLPIAVSRVDIITPLFWTSDADVDYPKDSYDMDTAAHIVFRPLFRFRQEQQRSWRRGADNSYRRSPYRRYNSYNSYPRPGYRYRPRYSGDYYG